MNQVQTEETSIEEKQKFLDSFNVNVFMRRGLEPKLDKQTKTIKFVEPHDFNEVRMEIFSKNPDEMVELIELDILYPEEKVNLFATKFQELNYEVKAFVDYIHQQLEDGNL